MAYTNILDFKDLYYDVKNKDESKFQEYVSIIRGMSGKIESGRLTGVMGNSGCGK
jgi:ABC-type multidrug transport system ATPase subunit